MKQAVHVYIYILHLTCMACPSPCPLVVWLTSPRAFSEYCSHLASPGEGARKGASTLRATGSLVSSHGSRERLVTASASSGPQRVLLPADTGGRAARVVDQAPDQGGGKIDMAGPGLVDIRSLTRPPPQFRWLGRRMEGGGILLRKLRGTPGA